MDWTARLQRATAGVDAWIQRVSPDRWSEPGGTSWTNQDLLGHLSAWSDLLMDEIEALRDEHPDTIEEVNIDRWNAEQVARRRSWTIDTSIAGWRRSAQRAAEVVAGLPPETWDRRWNVAWSADPVSVADLLRLWLVHLDQHQRALGQH